jgi:hypothetical protein
MQDEPIGGRGPLEDPDALEHVTLHLLLDSVCSPIWTMAEIARVLRSRPRAEDSVAALQDAGLVHRVGDFVFPTQSAIRFGHIAAVV